MDTGCLVSPKPDPMASNAITNNNVSNTATSKNISYKGLRNMKDLSLNPTIIVDTPSSTLTPLNTPRAHLLASLRTAPCSDRHLEFDIRSQRGEKISIPLQNTYKKDTSDIKEFKGLSYPHIATLSPKTTRGLGLPVYKQTNNPISSISEPSTPYQGCFDDSKEMTQQKFSSLLFSDSSFAQHTPSQQYIYPQKQMKNAVFSTPNTFTKSFNSYHTPEQHTFSYSPMMHELPYGLQSSYPVPTNMHSSSSSRSVSPYFFQNQIQNQNSLKKNKYGQNFQINNNGSNLNLGSMAGYYGSNTSAYKEGVPYRQPRGPPPMEELLSTNESENKNFSLRLRKQAISKIYHAGVQRQNNLSSSESAADEDEYVLKASSAI